MSLCEPFSFAVFHTWPKETRRDKNSHILLLEWTIFYKNVHFTFKDPLLNAPLDDFHINEKKGHIIPQSRCLFNKPYLRIQTARTKQFNIIFLMTSQIQSPKRIIEKFRRIEQCKVPLPHFLSYL